MSDTRFNARAPGDMRRLAERLLASPQAARPALAAQIAADGLMIPRQWWVRLAIWLGRKRHGADAFTIWLNINTRAPQMADDFIEQTAEWIVAGKDADGEGVGGLNQREVDRLNDMLVRLAA